MKIPHQVKSNPQEERRVEKKSLLERDINIVPQHISDKEKEIIYRQLNVLQHSGVDIRTSFEILFEQVKKKKTKEKLQKVLAELISGKSLSEALQTYKDFTPYEVFSIRIGEETGQLVLVLEKLTQYFENKIAQRRQVISAISYPVLIVLTSIGAVSFMIFFIIPMFEEVFVRFGGDLPSLTKWVINLSYSLRTNGIFFFLSVLLIIILDRVFKKNKSYRHNKEKLFIKIPIIGTIYKDVYLARFCDSMALLISSNVPMMRTLDMVKQMIGFVHIEKATEQVTKDLVQGKTLHESLSKHKVYDHQMLALIKVGEEVNQLGSFFQKLAHDYTNGVKHKTSLLSTFLEPVMVIFLGLVVGLILVAMYLPMFDLSSNMNI